MASTGIELDSYGPAETSSSNSAVQDALLPASSNHSDRGEDPFVPVNGTVHRKRRSSARRLFRLWRPLACIFTPIALVGLYSLLHPHVPALPPLPHVTITHGGSSSAPIIPPSSTCRCDAITDRTWTSDEAKRICDTYGKDALDRSRLYDGTGSRVRGVLNEAMDKRRPLKVGILGGSSEFSPQTCDTCRTKLSRLAVEQSRPVTEYIHLRSIHKETHKVQVVIPLCSKNG
jgi:hypothetical protein